MCPEAYSPSDQKSSRRSAGRLIGYVDLVTPPTISHEDLLDRLGEVIGRYGVQGSSIAMLSEASGLRKASLYHRFPGGKDEIVTAVANRAGALMELALASAYDDCEPVECARRVAEGIRDYYDDGARSCLIIALSIGDAAGRDVGLSCVDLWSAAFTQIAVKAGFGPDEAEDVALDAIASIEGALVISATSGRTGPFDRALAALPTTLPTLPG